MERVVRVARVARIQTRRWSNVGDRSSGGHRKLGRGRWLGSRAQALLGENDPGGGREELGRGGRRKEAGWHGGASRRARGPHCMLPWAGDRDAHVPRQARNEG
jgi:hypothetical protein